MSVRETIAEARVAQATGNKALLEECQRRLEEEYRLQPDEVCRILKGADAETVLYPQE